MSVRSVVERAAARKRRRRALEAQANPRIAYYSPMPPEATGIASYSRAVLDGLGRIGYLDRRRIEVVWPIEPKHEALAPWVRLGIYHLGNNIGFHGDIYRFACLAPGLVVLHDLALDDFVRGMRVAGEPLGFVAEREAAALAPRLRDLPDAQESEPLRTPWPSHVARRARGIVVHAPFGERYLRQIGCRTPIFVVPHPPPESEEAVRLAEERRVEFRLRAGAGRDDVLVVAPGDLNAAKQLDAVLAAVASLDHSVRVALVGRRIEGYDADALVSTSALGGRVTLAPDVADDEFLGWLAAADVAVDLRYPHRGEVSGSLARAMQLGRPSIVSGSGTYLDIPDEQILRIASGPADPDELASAIRRLGEDSGLRERIGASARAHMHGLDSSDATAHGYADAIEQTLELVRDPARKAYARWAAGLADLGIDETLVARGYGLSYARAMEGFKRSS